MFDFDILTINDQQGEYPNSHYASTINRKAQPSLKGWIEADICIVGGGFTGTSAALSLSKLGYKVVLLEAQRIGFGASGRNGGQIGTGQRLDVIDLEKKYGFDQAKSLMELGNAAHDYVSTVTKLHKIDIGYQSGVAHLEFNRAGVDHAAKLVDIYRKRYGYEKLETITANTVNDYINSQVYAGGAVDWGAGHGDPLALVLGIADAAMREGARIFENSRVTALEPNPKTDLGEVKARITLLACNGYLGELHRKTGRYVMPINNFVIATEPLGQDRAEELLPKNTAIADSKFVINYFRRSPDHRLLFGGGESYGYRFPTNLAANAQKPMLEIFPTLKDTKIDYAWGGTLAITLSRLPYVRKEGNLYVAAGYSGHGVALATYMGHLIAQNIHSENADFKLMSSLKHHAFPGGKALRHPLLVAAMLWYQMRDRLGI